MRKAKIYNLGIPAGELIEVEPEHKYKFVYFDDYMGQSISLTMPVNKKEYEFNEFPPFFDGLLPEGTQLEALIRQMKIDKKDFLLQLICVGKDLVGSVTIEKINE
jgi:serine/threonine-protein kinase HipA